jgi:hypothetical protein
VPVGQRRGLIDWKQQIPGPVWNLPQLHISSEQQISEIVNHIPGGSMSWVVGLPNNSYKPITNTAWVRARLCKLQKGWTRLAVASDKVYQMLAHGRWFSPGTLASSTTKTGRHDIAEIFQKLFRGGD